MFTLSLQICKNYNTNNTFKRKEKKDCQWTQVCDILFFWAAIKLHCLKTHKWTALLNWLTCSFIIMNMHTVVYCESHISSWCCKYPLVHPMYINLQLKIMVPKRAQRTATEKNKKNKQPCKWGSYKPELSTFCSFLCDLFIFIFLKRFKVLALQPVRDLNWINGRKWMDGLFYAISWRALSTYPQISIYHLN